MEVPVGATDEQEQPLHVTAFKGTPEEIEQLARQAASEHDGAPVQQYVPNLVYNEVKSKLVEESA